MVSPGCQEFFSRKQIFADPILQFFPYLSFQFIYWLRLVLRDSMAVS